LDIISKIKLFLDYNLHNTKSKQVLSLLVWNFLSIPVSFLINILVTNVLGAELYGGYVYLNSLFNVGITLINFGFFQAGNRVMVTSSSQTEIKEIFGAQLVIVLLLYSILTSLLILYSRYDSNLVKKHLQDVVFYIIPFGFVFLLNNYFETLLMANNQISDLVKTRYYPKIFFLTLLILYSQIHFIHTINSNALVLLIWYSLIISQLLVFIYVLIRIKFTFQNLDYRLKEIFRVNKTFGFQVYVGSLFSTFIMQLSPIIISYFSLTNKGVGFYSLSLTLASPLSFIPAIVGTTHYKDFSNYTNIPKKLLYYTLFLSFGLLFASWILIPIFIKLFYNPEFFSAIKLFYFTSIGVFLYGLSDFYSKFLGSKGYVVALRHSSFIVGAVALISNLLLVYLFNELGASISYLLAGITYLTTVLFYYKKFAFKN